jgi:hypothetical protein
MHNIAFIHNYTQQRCYDFPKNLAVFEPGSSVPEVDAMSTAPCRQGILIKVHAATIFVRNAFKPGLPDCIFLYQKSQFGCTLERLGIENVCILYGHLEYFTAIGYILWLFGIFSLFCFVSLRKIWQPCSLRNILVKRN